MAIQAQFPYSGSQDWLEYGCGGINHFNIQQPKQQLQQQQQQQQQQCNIQQLQNQFQRNQNLFFDNNLLASSPLKNTYNSNHHLSMGALASYDEKQRQEIDHYIRLQNERFRLLLQEQKRQQLALLLKKVESKALPLFKQKDEEIVQAAKRTVELEDFLKRLEVENQTWQRVAQENEAMIISLNNTIEQLRESGYSCLNNNDDTGDAESCCDTRSRVEEITGHGFVQEDDDDDIARKMVMVCKGCSSRNSCVLFLPCRHLCSCKACEAFLDSCPVCQTPKKASIEALMV